LALRAISFRQSLPIDGACGQEYIPEKQCHVTRNNGITEGFHNKMELINRQAYGFRNFENYRLRVKLLCG